MNNAGHWTVWDGVWPVPGAVARTSGLDVALSGSVAGPGRARMASCAGAGRRDDRQVSTQAPSWRVSPCRSRVRKLIAAHRVCSQNH
jgi:hypothetical protein